MTVVAFKDSVLPGKPNEDIVADLEMLLASAKNGELRGIAYATVREGNCLGTGWVGSDGTRNAIAMCIMLLHHRFAGSVLSGE